MALFEIKNLSKSYKHINALKDVSFQINSGEIVALIGKNGAGKTTLLNCIAGNIIPNNGKIIYKNINLLKDDSLLNEFGILIKASFFDYLNCYDNLKLLIKASGIKDTIIINKKINEILSLVGLQEKKKAYVKGFSFGQKQRLGLAQALLHNPNFLILDEPFVGLDPLGKRILKSIIVKKAKEKKSGVLFSSHDLDDISEICDRVIMINNGKKIFDDKFMYKKTYSVICENKELDFIRNTVIDKFNSKVKVINNKLEFVHTNLINEVFKFLFENNVKISDITIKENSLYDFFEKEVTE